MSQCRFRRRAHPGALHGYRRDWSVQFPKGIREPGARYLVTEVRESGRGGFYRTHGDIRRLR